MGFVKEFKEFAVKGNMIDMAVGIIIGGAFGKIVSSLVSDVIMPPIALVSDKMGDFQEVVWTLRAGEGPDGKPVQVKIGSFIDNVVSFLIVAFAVFLLVKGINALKRKQEEEEKKAPTPPKQEVLLTEIRDLLAKQ